MHIMLDDGKSESPLKVLLLCLAAVLMPWLWGVWAMPLWVALVSLVLSAVSIFLIFWMIRRNAENLRARESSAPQSANRQHNDGSSETTATLRAVLSVWLGSSQAANGSLQQARATLDEVTEQSEGAAASIGKSFRVVMQKSGQQMEDALRLLKTTSDGAGGSTWLSLPDFIKAYEKQLDTVTDRMMDFSKASEEMSRHQELVRNHSLAIDEMLDELRNMAARVRKLALDSTVAANRDATTDSRWFIEIADRIRETSTSAHELTRRMRDGLEKIREVMGRTYEELSKSSDNVRMAAVQAKVDVSQLNIATMEKAREVTGTLEKITALGNEVRHDINQIIVAMQYQDITQQKLEHVKSPLLTAAAASLAEAAARTRAAGITHAADAIESMGEAPAKTRDDLLPGKAKSVDVELF
jgi:methyl-accepting chemotaxis protein